RDDQAVTDPAQQVGTPEGEPVGPDAEVVRDGVAEVERQEMPGIAERREHDPEEREDDHEDGCECHGRQHNRPNAGEAQPACGLRGVRLRSRHYVYRRRRSASRPSTTTSASTPARKIATPTADARPESKAANSWL